MAFTINEIDDGGYSLPPNWLASALGDAKDRREFFERYASVDPDLEALILLQKAEMGTVVDYDSVVEEIAELIRFAKFQAPDSIRESKSEIESEIESAVEDISEEPEDDSIHDAW